MNSAGRPGTPPRSAGPQLARGPGCRRPATLGRLAWGPDRHDRSVLATSPQVPADQVQGLVLVALAAARAVATPGRDPSRPAPSVRARRRLPRRRPKRRLRRAARPPRPRRRPSGRRARRQAGCSQTDARGRRRRLLTSMAAAPDGACSTTWRRPSGCRAADSESSGTSPPADKRSLLSTSSPIQSVSVISTSSAPPTPEIHRRDARHEERGGDDRPEFSSSLRRAGARERGSL